MISISDNVRTERRFVRSNVSNNCLTFSFTIIKNNAYRDRVSSMESFVICVLLSTSSLSHLHSQIRLFRRRLSGARKAPSELSRSHLRFPSRIVAKVSCYSPKIELDNTVSILQRVYLPGEVNLIDGPQFHVPYYSTSWKS
jgi:hypothetical protein